MKLNKHSSFYNLGVYLYIVQNLINSQNRDIIAEAMTLWYQLSVSKTKNVFLF